MSALEEDRDFLLRSLEDLERERDAGDIEEADYVALKEDYTVRAAAVLRALSADPPPEPAAEPAQVRVGSAATSGPQARRREAAAGAPAGAPAGGGRWRWRPVAVLAVLLAFATAAGMLVARSAGERTPGQAASGEIAATGPSAEIADELAEARDLIGEGRTLDAIKVYDRILERDAEQPEALAYRGWLLRLAGKAAGDTALVDKGMEFIERAVAADPGYPDARFFRAFVNYQDRKDPAAAVPDLRAYLAGNSPPEMRPVVEDLLRRALADVERGAVSPQPVPVPSTTAPPPAPGG